MTSTPAEPRSKDFKVCCRRHEKKFAESNLASGEMLFCQVPRVAGRLHALATGPAQRCQGRGHQGENFGRDSEIWLLGRWYTLFLQFRENLCPLRWSFAEVWGQPLSVRAIARTLHAWICARLKGHRLNRSGESSSGACRGENAEERVHGERSVGRHPAAVELAAPSQTSEAGQGMQEPGPPGLEPQEIQLRVETKALPALPEMRAVASEAAALALPGLTDLLQRTGEEGDGDRALGDEQLGMTGSLLLPAFRAGLFRRRSHGTRSFDEQEEQEEQREEEEQVSLKAVQAVLAEIQQARGSKERAREMQAPLPSKNNKIPSLSHVLLRDLRSSSKPFEALAPAPEPRPRLSRQFAGRCFCCFTWLSSSHLRRERREPRVPA